MMGVSNRDSDVSVMWTMLVIVIVIVSYGLVLGTVIKSMMG